MVENRTDGSDDTPVSRADSDAGNRSGTGSTAAPEHALYRDAPVEPASQPDVDAERERLVAERAARREARLAALAPRPEPAPEHATAARPESHGATASSALPVRTETVRVTERSTDRFVGALGLFLLRLITAAITGIHGLNHLLNLPATAQMLEGTVLPMPGVLAVVLGAAEVAIAIALVFGLLTRVAGLALAVLAGVSLAFIQWGPWSPFTPGQPGFAGELELLLLGVGLLFLCVGGGGWSIDHGFRARRGARAEA